MIRLTCLSFEPVWAEERRFAGDSSLETIGNEIEPEKPRDVRPPARQNHRELRESDHVCAAFGISPIQSNDVRIQTFVLVNRLSFGIEHCFGTL
jgi:hypothetical protein